MSRQGISSEAASCLRLLSRLKKPRRYVVVDQPGDWLENSLLKERVAPAFTVIRRSPLDKSMAERRFRHVQSEAIASEELLCWLQGKLPPKLEQGDKDQSAHSPMQIEIDTLALDISLVAEDGTVIRRPVITVAIDTSSRTVLKAEVSEGRNSAGRI